MGTRPPLQLDWAARSWDGSRQGVGDGMPGSGGLLRAANTISTESQDLRKKEKVMNDFSLESFHKMTTKL